MYYHTQKPATKTAGRTRTAALLSAFGIGLLVAVTFLPGAAHAAVTFGQIGQNLGNQSQGIAYFLKMLAWLVGFGALMGGIIGFIFRHKTNMPMGVILSMILGGILLLSIMAVASSGSASTFGSDQTSSAMSALGN